LSQSGSDLSAAYRACTLIARREAKNFYYAFLALPKAKRDAICAVYAFMRHADDLSDDETRSREQRRADLQAWLESWHRAAAGQATTDPVFLALSDARRRFDIPMELLDHLVQGTAMDLHAPASGAYDTYATFDDLRQYCYYVASVVGLVCIRIFGYSDPGAEGLAEETGLAFQLTNILRDVREDAARGRIYLPLNEMERHGVGVEELAGIRAGSQITPGQRALLASIAQRAQNFYESGRELLPLIAADARPALWVLVQIYRDLLRRIERRNYDVFSERVRVPVSVRVAILLRGLLQVLRNRLTGQGRQ
jgi:phytoene synthase